MAAKRFRSFSTAPEVDASGAPVVAVEPLGFGLNGEEFEVLPDIPGAVLLEFLEGADTGNGAGSILKFFKDVMSEEEYARFDKVIKDPKVIVKLEDLTDIVKFLAEEYTARPTTAS